MAKSPSLMHRKKRFLKAACSTSFRGSARVWRKARERKALCARNGNPLPLVAKLQRRRKQRQLRTPEWPSKRVEAPSHRARSSPSIVGSVISDGLASHLAKQHRLARDQDVCVSSYRSTQRVISTSICAWSLTE